MKMKKLLFIVSSFLFLSANAQVEKGRFLIGGSADVSEMYQGKNSGFSMTIAPAFGIFVVNGFNVGAKYSFGISNSKTFSNSTKQYTSTTTFTTGIGPQLKYYIGKKPLKGLISANVNYLTSVTVKKTSVSGTDGMSATGLLGMAYFFNRYVSLESGLYLSGTSYVKQLPVTRIGFSVGVYTFIDKKKHE